MRSKIFRITLLILVSLMIPSSLLAAEGSSANAQASRSDEQKYAGAWAGTYSNNEGNGDKVTFILSRDEKGQWRGTAKWINQDGEQTAELKALQIADGKLKAKIEAPDGQAEVAIEGQFQADKFEGTYSVSPKGSTEVVEKGTWKTTMQIYKVTI